VYLVHLLSRIHGIKSILEYSESLYSSRYQSFFPIDSLYIQQQQQQQSNNDRFICFKDQPKVYNSLIDKLDRRKIESAAIFVSNQLNHHMFSASKKSSSSSFSSSSSSSSSSRPRNRATSAVKWTWLGNYVEQIARYCVLFRQ
jgi:hypothetical protein